MSSISSVIQELGGKERLVTVLQSNLLWIKQSFKVNNNLGSSGIRSLKGSWGDVYPETTGYLVPTLHKLGLFLGDEEACELAIHQLAYFESIQNEDGSFYQSNDNQRPILFDTAQILEGLHYLAHTVQKSKPVLKMTIQAVDWLGKQLDKEGNFTDYQYVANYNPAYHSRVAWKMASAELIKYSKPRTKTKALIDRIAELQNENKTYKNWGFEAGAPAFSHTVAYTLRGLWECADITHNRKLRKSVLKSITELAKSIDENGVAGSYDNNWQGDYGFLCAAGNAQLAILFTSVYRYSGDKKFLDLLSPLLQPLLKAQRSKLIHRGAIPSSIPMRGAYQRFKYTNWTQKFFCDAILGLFDEIGSR